MSTNRQTTEYARAYAELERIASRLRSGDVPLDDLEALLARADRASAIVGDRLRAVARLVRHPSLPRASKPS